MSLSFSELYENVKKTGVGAMNVPWCGKKTIFTDEKLDSMDKYSKLKLKYDKVIHENKILKRCIKNISKEIRHKTY